MPKLEVEINVAASPEKVWRVLSDFAKYAEWHPHQTVAGEAQAFAKIRISYRMTDGRQSLMEKAVVWRVEPEHSLEILSGSPILYMTRRYFHLSPTEGGTRVHHGVHISGLWAAWKFTSGSKIERLRPYYTAVAEALARRATGKGPASKPAVNRHARRVADAKRDGARRDT